MPLPPPMTDDLPPPNSREHTVRRWRWGGQASFREHTVRCWRWGLASFAAAAGCDSLSGELQTAPNAVGDFIATGPRTPESNEADRTPPGTRPVSLVFFPNRERAIVLLASFPSFSLRLSRRSSGEHGRSYIASSGLVFLREPMDQHPFSTSMAIFSRWPRLCRRRQPNPVLTQAVGMKSSANQKAALLRSRPSPPHHSHVIYPWRHGGNEGTLCQSVFLFCLVHLIDLTHHLPLSRSMDLRRFRGECWAFDGCFVAFSRHRRRHHWQPSPAGARCNEHPNAPRKERPRTWSARKISDGAVAAGKTADRVHCGAAGRFPWLCQTKDDETTSRQDLRRSSHGNAAAEPEAKAKLTAHSQRQEMSKGAAAAVSRAGSTGGSEQQQPSGGGEGKRSHQRGTCAVCTCTGPPHAPRPASCLLLLSRCSSRPAMGVASNAATHIHWGGGVGNRERPALARAAPTRCSDVGGV